MTFLGIALLFLLAALIVFAIDLMIPTGGVLVAVTGILGVIATRTPPVGIIRSIAKTIRAASRNSSAIPRNVMNHPSIPE
ncbi:MAG: hypothetical protein ACKOAU_14325 [Pirellula sp.]